MLTGLASAVPRSSDESLDPGTPGDLDRLIRSMTVGLRRILSGERREDVPELLRIPRVCRDVTAREGPLSGLDGVSILPSMLEVSSRLDRGGNFPSFKSYRLTEGSVVARCAWRSARVMLFRLDPWPVLSSVRIVLRLASRCTVTGAMVGSAAMELGALGAWFDLPPVIKLIPVALDV